MALLSHRLSLFLIFLAASLSNFFSSTFSPPPPPAPWVVGPLRSELEQFPPPPHLQQQQEQLSSSTLSFHLIVARLRLWGPGWGPRRINEI